MPLVLWNDAPHGNLLLLAMLSVPIKRGAPTSTLARGMAAYVTSEYGSEGEAVLGVTQSGCERLAALRIAAVEQAPSGANVARHAPTDLSAYRKLLAAADGVLVDGLGKPAVVVWSWADAFTPKRTARQPAAAGWKLERAAVAFNLAAWHSQLGVMQERSTPEGVKTAARHFAAAAAGFQEALTLGEKLDSPTADLQPAFLRTAVNVMLAQGQVCFCEKAIGDGMKDSVVAKLCAQAAQYYRAALADLRACDTVVVKAWTATVQSQFAVWRVTEQMRVAHEDHEVRQAIGTELSRLTYCLQLIDSTLKQLPKGTVVPQLQDLAGVANMALAEARKENSTIYHMETPAFDSLAPVELACMARPDAAGLDVDADALAPEDRVAFDAIAALPTVAEQRAASARQRAEKEAAEQRARALAEARKEARVQLREWDLPMAVDVVLAEKGLPPALAARIDAVRATGGVADHLDQLMAALSETARENGKLLDEIEKTLDEEQREDEEQRQRWGPQQWGRPASAAEASGMRAELSRFRTIFTQAADADKIVRSKFAERRDRLKSLLDAGADLSVPAAVPADSEVAAQATRIRECIARAESTATDADAVRAAMGDLKPLLDLFLASTSATAGAQGASPRADALRRLETAVDEFDDLASNLREGLNCHSQVSDMVARLRSVANDWAYARRTEKMDLLANIQRSLTTQYAAPTPSRQPGAPSAPPM